MSSYGRPEMHNNEQVESLSGASIISQSIMRCVWKTSTVGKSNYALRYDNERRQRRRRLCEALSSKKYTYKNEYSLGEKKIWKLELSANLLVDN